MEVKIVIDGEEVVLEKNGTSRKGTYDKFKEPENYATMGLGESPLIVTAYVKPGWKPSQEGQASLITSNAYVGKDGRESYITCNELSKELKSFDNFLSYGTTGKERKSERTRRAYLYTVETFYRYLDERKPTPELAEEFIAELKKTNNPSSLNRHLWALKSYFRFLGQEFSIPSLKTDTRHPGLLTEREWQRLLTATTDLIHDSSRSQYGRFRAKFELALLYVFCDLGLRPSEVISLKVDDVLDTGYVRITGPDVNSYLVPISGSALKSIKDYIHDRNNQERYLFPGKEPNTHMAARTAEGIIITLFRRAGLPDARARNLRYRTIQQLRKMGAAGVEIKAQIDFETP